MGIYILLLVFMFAMFFVEHSKTHNNHQIDNRNNRLLGAIFLLIFLICALRNSTVGRDIPGYEIVYGWTKAAEWGNYNYVYFEHGYLLLSKICTSLGMSFQWFLATCYIIILYPIYLFIRRYSTDKVISAFIYVCYVFFEFDLTGLRQAISMSIVLMGFMVLLENKKRRLLYYTLIVLLAAQFHKGAYICLVLIPFLYIKNYIIFIFSTVIGCVVSLLARRYLFTYIKTFFDKQTFSLDAGLYIGLNLVLLILLAVVFTAIQINQNMRSAKAGDMDWKIIDNESANVLLLEIFMLSIMTALFFGSETSARSYMYFNQTLIVIFPNYFIKLNNSKSKLLFNLAAICFFVGFFYMNSLSGGGFDIVPYKFFWEI